MQNLITQHLDIWTAAQAPKNNVGRGRKKNGNGQTQYGIKKLRKLILDLAIRGKLVPQDPNDEPASVLLEKIAKEKTRLIKEGKIRKQKKLPKIAEGEKPFDLPEGWRFVRFGNVTFNRDAERIPLSVEERRGRQGEYDYYGASGVIDYIDGFLFEKPLLLIGEDGANLINRSTPIAFIARGKYWVNNHAHVLDGLTEDLLLYICLHINAISLEPYVTGTAQPKMNQSKMNSIVLALPPSEEQNRIVAKVDELMALCDQLEQQQEDTTATHQTLVENVLDTLTKAPDHDEFNSAWQRISNHFDTLFTTEQSIDQLKQTILQLAVMGKLVSQDPNDEPASVLLEKINELRSRLIKSGIEKKSKALVPIKKSEIPFQIKSNWKWVKLGEIHEVTSSKRIHKKDYVPKGIPFLRSKEVGELGRGESISTDIFIREEKFNELKSLPGFPKYGDLMLASIGASIGNNWISDEREFYYKDGNVTKIGNHELANMSYLKLFISSPLLFRQVFEQVAGSAYNALTIVKIKNLHYPLPPLKEQGRIVAKVDELMALCDKLKSRINEAQTIQNQLADTIIEQAVV